MDNRIIAIVGMTGSGKSVVAESFEIAGWSKIRFGDITMEELEKRGLEVNEANERAVREELRQVHGMAAYAKLNIPRIEKAIDFGNVILDGLYSWEEYLILRNKFPDMIVLAVQASPKTRYKRLTTRKERPLTNEEAISRDKSEIINLHKAGPIAMADVTFNNEGTVKDLKKQIDAFMKTL